MIDGVEILFIVFLLTIGIGTIIIIWFQIKDWTDEDVLSLRRQKRIRRQMCRK